MEIHEIESTKTENSPAELKRQLALAEEALRLADERAAAGHLALEVLHDIRNPLEAMRNLNYLTSVAAHNADDVRRYTGLAEEQLTIAIEIANKTLGFAKAVTRPRATNLATLFEAGIRIHQRTIDRKQIRILKDFAADAVVPIFPGELLQVISNLITNALAALPEKGTLWLRLRKRRNGVHLIVADNGHGIAKQDAAQVFQPFFTTKEQGTGLGLALAHKVVEGHHGTIRLRSRTSPGRSGTVFRILLPF